MKRFVSQVWPFSLALLALILGSCISQAAPVQFSETWPTQAAPYEESTENWTRRGLLRASLDNQGSQLLELHATFLSTEWRAAYVQRQSELQKLSKKSQNTLAEEQKKLGASYHQVKLIISTYHPEHNDLHRDRSMWRVVLVDDEGNEIPAEKIEKDRRPKQLITAEFDKLGDFAEAYLATFPHAATLLSGKKFSLRISCSLGTVEVDWVSE